MENTLDVEEKDIFKGIAKLTLLKRSAIVPPRYRIILILEIILAS
jgi:hypothetical protein